MRRRISSQKLQNISLCACAVHNWPKNSPGRMIGATSSGVKLQCIRNFHIYFLLLSVFIAILSKINGDDDDVQR